MLDIWYSAIDEVTFGLGVQRTALFELLYEAAVSAGVAIVPDTEIKALRTALGGKTRIVTRWGQRSEQYDLIVDALGAKSILSPEEGVDFEYGALWTIVDWPTDSPLAPRSLEQRYELAGQDDRRVACWCSQIGPDTQSSFFWSLKRDCYEQWRKTPLKRWKDDVLALWPDVEPLLAQISSHEA